MTGSESRAEAGATADPTESADRTGVARIGRRADRGQLVLLAAGVVAVALVPLVLAYLQLGYHGDVRAGGEVQRPGENAERLLSRAVHEAALAANGSLPRPVVVENTRERLAPRLETLRSSRVARGTVYRVSYNDTAARDWADANCPGGPDRQFGDCQTDGGIVTQRRDGETHVLAVGVDVTVTTDRGRRRLTLVVRAVGGAAG